MGQLPAELQHRILDAMSPLEYLPELRAPLVVLRHDHDDPVIPMSESVRLRDALAGRVGLHYTDPAQMALRTAAACSPIPPVKTSRSRPPSTAARAPRCFFAT